MELEPSSDLPITPIGSAADARKKIEEPLPVRLVTVDDAHLLCAAGLETELDAFYVEILKFVREPAPTLVPLPSPDPSSEAPNPVAPNPAAPGGAPLPIVYRADNFRLIFNVVEPPVQRADLRMLGVEVPSLLALEKTFIDREIPYEWQKGLLPGQQALVLLDPAGNWLQIVELKIV